MPLPVVAVQLASLRLPPRKALHAAAAMGARAVEIDARGEFRATALTGTALREIQRLLEHLELKVVAIGFQTRRGYDDPADLTRRVEGTKAALRLAGALRAGVVINHLGRVPADADAPPWQPLLEVIADLGQFGNHVGAKLAANTGSDSPQDLARLLAALPTQSIGINLDPGRLAMGGYSALECAQKLAADIVHVHARDGVRDLATRRGHEVPLGQGSVDFPAVIAALAERHYQGAFTVARDDSTDPVEDLAQGLQFMRGIFP